MSGPYKVGEFGPGLIKDWGVSGPAGSEHSEHWSRKDAIQMAERLNRAHAAALESLREKVREMRRQRQIDLDTARSAFIAGGVNELDRVLALLDKGAKP